MTQQELKNICQQKLQESIASNDTKKIEIYTLIDQMLSQKDAIKMLGVEVTMNILYDLGFNKKQAQKIYLEFIK